MLKEVIIAAIIHEVGRHGDLLAHHVGKCEDRAIWVDLKQFLDDFCVGRLVPLLVRGDDAAYLGEFQVSFLLGVTGCVAVGYEGCSLLEGGVDEAEVGIVLGPRVL